MATNNFDMSSNGVSLELHCFKDSGLSRIYFEDTIEVIRYSSYRENCQLFYTGGEEYEFTGSLLDYYETPKGKTTKQLLLLWAEFKGESVRDIISDVLMSTKEKRLACVSSDVMASLLADYCYDNDERRTWYEFAEYNFTLSMEVVRGYTQGDYAELYYVPGSEPNIDYLEKVIYDAPAYCRLDVDGEDYFLDEGLTCSYDYKKEEIMGYAKNTLEHEKKDYIISWMEENLPDYPDYL